MEQIFQKHIVHACLCGIDMKILRNPSFEWSTSVRQH